MKYEILLALFRERFDSTYNEYYTTIGDMVNWLWDPLDHQNQNMVDRYNAAVDGELNLSHQFYSY